jgi:DNA-directed RNA polymerase specialized sigma subunit
MWESYRHLRTRFQKISLQEERRLIRQAQKGSEKAREELVLRHIGFVIFRIHKRAFPAYVRRFGEDILSQALFILYEKIKSYNLNYRDKKGSRKPVRFTSFIWKRIDGFIIDYIRKELKKEKEAYVIFRETPEANGRTFPATLQGTLDDGGCAPD